MFKTNIVIGILALALFANAQYQGWSLFDSTASSNQRLAGSGSRTYHK